MAKEERAMEENRILTDQEYEALTKKVIAFCEELWKRKGYPFLLDLDITEDLKERGGALQEYLKYVFDDWKQSGYTKTGGYEILPPWYAYPDLSMGSIGWRMGSGESYSMIFSDYYDSLSEEGQQRYDRKYPEPPFYNEEYLDEHWDEIRKAAEEAGL